MVKLENKRKRTRDRGEGMEESSLNCKRERRRKGRRRKLLSKEKRRKKECKGEREEIQVATGSNFHPIVVQAAI